MSKPKPNGDDAEYIFTKRITLRNGKVLYAHEVGRVAFRIRVNPKKKPKK